MAFKIWQIGLHLQQQEAVAVAIVRGAKECFLQRCLLWQKGCVFM